MNTEEFVESLATVEAIKLAGILCVDCEMPPWSETGYQDKAVALREALVHRIEAKAAAFDLVGVSAEAWTIAAKLPTLVPRQLRSLMHVGIINMLNDTETFAGVMEMLYDDFFAPDEDVSKEYEQQVDAFCEALWEMYRLNIIKLLHTMV